MTHDLTTRLTGTLSGLKIGLPISALNRLRRREEEQQMTDARETILWRLATARDRVRKLDVPDEVDLEIWIRRQVPTTRWTISHVLTDQLALVTDCAAEIRQRDATIAELRGRVAALEAMTPGGAVSDATRRDDAHIAIARLREHCHDYGYGFDVKESRGPAISAAMCGGTVVEIVITVRVEEPDGVVRE